MMRACIWHASGMYQGVGRGLSVQQTRIGHLASGMYRVCIGRALRVHQECIRHASDVVHASSKTNMGCHDGHASNMQQTCLYALGWIHTDNT